MSPKRKQGEEVDLLYPGHKDRPQRKVTVLELRDLEGEYLLVLARLQLIKVDADPTHATGREYMVKPGARFSKVPKSFQAREAITKTLILTFPELFFSQNFHTNKVNFHAKFNAYTLLPF